MKKLLLMTVVLALGNNLLHAADPSEQGVYTSPLTTYGWGFGVGGVAAINDELRDKSENFLKVSFVNSVYFKDRVNIFFDASWFAPGANFSADVGVDYFLSKSDFRPFLGAGVGATYFDKSDDFGDNIGPSATAHIGFLFDINESVQLRFRLPFTYVLNETRDQFGGLEVSVLISDKFKRVKKLEYNR